MNSLLKNVSGSDNINKRALDMLSPYFVLQAKHSNLESKRFPNPITLAFFFRLI